MCCSKRRQPRQAIVEEYLGVPHQPRQRGCCRPRRDQPTMAGIIAIGIGMGAEKLGRKISEKRLEKKEKKTALEHEALYGHTGSSSSAAATTPQRHVESRNEKTLRKSEDARRQQEYNVGRRSLSEERDEPPPPRYEDVLREDARRM